MRRLIREQQHSPAFNQAMKILRRTAAVLLIIAITSFSCLMSVEAYRTKFIDMVIRVFNDLTDYRFRLSESSTSNIASLPHPVLSNLPHSMYKTDEHNSDNSYAVTYESDNGDFLDLICTFIFDNTDTHKLIDSENAQTAECKIHGESATMIEKNDMITLIWTHDHILIHLYSNLSTEQCRTIAEYIILEDF